MKLTKDRLKQIIKEELEEIMYGPGAGVTDPNPVDTSPNAGLRGAIMMFKKHYSDLSKMNPNLTGPQKIDKALDTLTSAQIDLLNPYLKSNPDALGPDMGKSYADYIKQSQMQERKKR